MSRPTRRPPIVGRYTLEEVALAARNSGMPLEALRHDVTPAGLHYSLIHFDIPQVERAVLAARGGRTGRNGRSALGSRSCAACAPARCA